MKIDFEINVEGESIKDIFNLTGKEFDEGLNFLKSLPSNTTIGEDVERIIAKAINYKELLALLITYFRSTATIEEMPERIVNILTELASEHWKAH